MVDHEEQTKRCLFTQGAIQVNAVGMGKLISKLAKGTPLGHLRMTFVVLIRFLAPRKVPSLIHRPLAVVPLILHVQTRITTLPL